MGFIDELRARNTSTGPIGPNTGLGSQRGESLEGTLNTLMPFLHQMRNRSLEDYKAKALFDNNLSMQQGGIRRMDPNAMGGGQPNVVMGQTQNEITPFQKATLNIDQQRLGIDARRLKQADQTGDEKLDLDRQKFGLEQQKNAQIYDTKIKDMERKSEEAANKLELAQKQLEARQGDAAAQLAFHQAQLEATKAQHALEMAQRDKEHTETKRVNDARISQIKKAVEDSGFTMEELDTTDEGKQIKLIRKGSDLKGKMIPVIGPDGQTGNVPAEEVSSLPPGWKKR